MSRKFLKTWHQDVLRWATTYVWVKQIPTEEIPWIVAGKLGEVLVSKYLTGKVTLNWDIIDASNDSGVDLTYGDKKIDVKTSTFFSDPLLKEFIKVKGGSKDDIVYGLVSLNLEKYKYCIHGFIEAKRFISDEFFVPNWKGLGPRYIAKTSDLNPEYFFT
jgi:hypothetical protein